jgi:hypothetical protein
MFRVHHQQVALGRVAVDDDVVDGRPTRHGQRRVLGLAVAYLRHVVGGDALQERERARAQDLELPHVGDVEEAGGLADGQVLGDQAGILDRHVPAAEGNHLRAAFPVNLVEGCLSKGGCGGLQRPSLVHEPRNDSLLTAERITRPKERSMHAEG